MAIETLKTSLSDKFRHHAGHDLESLLHTMVTICTYTNGPGGNLREYVKPTEGKKEIKLNEWFATFDRDALAQTKTLTLEAFNSFVKPHLPEYWQDFAPFLQRLIHVTWDKPLLYEATNIATHKAYRDILKDALDKYTAEEKKELAVYAYIPKAKRSIDDNQSRHSKRSRVGNAENLSAEELLPRRDNSYFLEDYVESVERCSSSLSTILDEEAN